MRHRVWEYLRALGGRETVQRHATPKKGSERPQRRASGVRRPR